MIQISEEELGQIIANIKWVLAYAQTNEDDRPFGYQIHSNKLGRDVERLQHLIDNQVKLTTGCVLKVEYKPHNTDSYIKRTCVWVKDPTCTLNSHWLVDIEQGVFVTERFVGCDTLATLKQVISAHQVVRSVEVVGDNINQFFDPL